MNEFISVVKKYAVFSGRARRKEFWMYVLFYVIIIGRRGSSKRIGPLPFGAST